MTATASNLSDSHYGFDLVCATTQDAVNATMKQFLSGYAGKAFSACYCYDANNQLQAKPLAEIQAAIGGDPFTIPDGANQTNPMVKKLAEELQFGFAFKATMGLPTGVAPRAMPDIVRFDKGSSRVTYQLYCADFSVIVLDEHFGRIKFENFKQSSSSPWLFEFEVNLDMRQGDQNAFNALPNEVKARIKNIDPNSMFGVQQLYLDLNSAGLQQMPSIQGLDPTSDAYINLTRVFINQYWKNLGQSGVVLGYAVKPATASNITASIVPTDLNIEISPYVDSHGNATTQYGLYTIDYLVMSQNRRMPPPVTFNWNWVDSSEVADFHGAIAIRRDIFTDYLLGLVNRNTAQLCIDPNVELHHSGEHYTIQYSWRQSGSPTSFSKVAPLGAPDAQGFVNVMTMSYGHNSYDDSMASSHLSSINGTFNYSINGNVAIGGNKIRITLHAVVYVEFVTHEAGVKHTIVDGNALDLTHTTTYELHVTQDGHLVVNPSSSDSGGINNLYYGSDPLMTNLGNIKDSVRDISSSAGNRAKTAMQNFGNDLGNMINNSHAWVFPGGRTFIYKAAGFSTGLDLISHITYTDPT